MPAADQVESFLAANPGGGLRVVTGYASIGGLRWLGERTAGRPVSLLIGDMSKTHFRKAGLRDCEDALALLGRGDVQVVTRQMRNSPKDAGKPVPIVHAKAWMAWRRNKPRVLAGSANLTFQGMYRNVEMMALAEPGDARRLWDEMEELFARSKPAEDQIRDSIAAVLARHRADGAAPARSPGRGQTAGGQRPAVPQPRRRTRDAKPKRAASAATAKPKKAAKPKRAKKTRPAAG